MYYYESHLGGIYTTEHEQDYDDLYCEECGDSDTLIGEYDSEEDFLNNNPNYKVYMREKHREEQEDRKQQDSLNNEKLEPNKYGLVFKDLKRLKLIDLEKLKTKAWRNESVKAWCISESIGTDNDREYGTDNYYWLGFYDNGKVRCDLTSYGGMCGYVFNRFYDKNEIENQLDRVTQSRLLKTVNWLLDNKVCILDKKLKKKGNKYENDQKKKN